MGKKLDNVLNQWKDDIKNHRFSIDRSLMAYDKAEGDDQKDIEKIKSMFAEKFGQ